MTTRSRPRAAAPRRSRRRALPQEWEAIYSSGVVIPPSNGQHIAAAMFLGVLDKVSTLRGIQGTLNPVWSAQPTFGSAGNLIYGFIKVTRSDSAFDSGNDVAPSDVATAANRRALLAHKTGFLSLNWSNQPILEINYGGLALAEREGLYLVANQVGTAPLTELHWTFRAIRRTRTAD